MDSNVVIMPGSKLVPIIKKTLDSGNDFKLLVTGTSMYPFVYNNRDSVLLTAVSNVGIKRGEVVFVQRDSGEYILHRVIKILPNNRFIMNGDAQVWTEIIRHDQVFACVKTIYRKGRIIQHNSMMYVLVSRLWIKLRPLRPAIFKIRNIIKRLFNI